MDGLHPVQGQTPPTSGPWLGARETESPRSLSASAPHQALLRTLLALAAFSTATAAIIIGAGRFYEYHFIFYKGICNVSSSWRPTGAPSPSGPELGRLQQCTTYMNMLKVAGGGHTAAGGGGGGSLTLDGMEAVHQRGRDLFCPDRQTGR